MRILAILALVCVGCGDDSSSPVCAVGETQGCVGPGGCMGGQVCLADRSGWSVCDCGDASIDASSDVGVDALADTGGDATVDAVGDAGSDAGCVETELADVLIVMDATNVAAEEQVALAADISDLIRVLVTGDVDGDGSAEVEGLTDVHIGVVSTDLGAGSDTVPTCTISGDDGVLSTRGGPGCAAALDAIQTVGDIEDAGEVACLIEGVGIGGCAFAHPLDAALKALTSSSSSVRFAQDTLGHGDVANAGFRRSAAPLGVLIVSSRDDCSASDLELFNPGAAAYADTPLNQRCTRDDALHPLSRYPSEAFGDSSRLVFGVIAGLPDDVGLTEGAAVTTLASDARLEPVLEDDRIADVCTYSGGGAQPGQRLVGAAASWVDDAAGVVVGGVCQESYESLLVRFAELLARTARCSP